MKSKPRQKYSEAFKKDKVKLLVSGEVRLVDLVKMFVQIADCIVTALRLREYPKGSLRKYDAHRYFDFLSPLLLETAAPSDTSGIIRA